MVEKRTISYIARKGQKAKHCKSCILSVQYPFTLFHVLLLIQIFSLETTTLLYKLFDWYGQLSQWSPPLVQIKEWQWSTQGERYLHSQSERKMMESCKLTIVRLWTILWCDHPNATSLTVLLHATIILHYFTKWTLEFLLNFYFKHFWEWKG